MNNATQLNSEVGTAGWSLMLMHINRSLTDGIWQILTDMKIFLQKCSPFPIFKTTKTSSQN